MSFVSGRAAVLIALASAEMSAPLVYEGKRDLFTVPAGFRTDFASVPQFCQWLVPRLGLWTLAAILHDYLCGLVRQGLMSSWDADGIFRRVMAEEGVPLVLRWLVWTAVRWGALFSAYRRAGWWAPGNAAVVLGLSLVWLPVVAPVSLLVLAGLAVVWLAEAVTSWLT